MDFLFYPWKIGWIFCKNVSKYLVAKYSQKFFDHATYAFKTASNRTVQKTADTTGELIAN